MTSHTRHIPTKGKTALRDSHSPLDKKKNILDSHTLNVTQYNFRARSKISEGPSGLSESTSRLTLLSSNPAIQKSMY